MLAAKKAKVIVLEIENDVGILHRISKIVAEKGINIIGATGEVSHKIATIRLITDDNLRAKDALMERAYDFIETDAVAIEMPNKPGILETLTGKLADAGIDIIHLAATAPASQDECLLLIETNDIAATVVQLNQP